MIRFTAFALLLQCLQAHASYHTADRLTQINEPNRSIDYTLDGVANRLTETITDNNNQTTTQDKTYSYNSRDQLQQVQDAIGGALITYQYDNNGNQTQKTDASGTTNLVYGPRDRLLTITLPGAPPIAYSYNEAGLRDSQSQNGQTLHYIYDQTSLIAETNSINDEIARYTHSSVGLIAEARSGVQSYLHTDALSTPIAVTDIAGGVTSSYTWDTWGNLQQQTGVSQQPFGFTGYQRDEQTGLHYAQQRYYDSEIGRFNRHDPFRGDIDTPLSLHRYLYANANPTIFVDPDGREACIGAALINCPVDQFIANNRSVPVQISEQAFAGIPETTAVAADRSEQLVSLPPPQQVFTRNFRLVPQVDPERLDGVIAFNAVALDNGEGQFRIAPRDLNAFIRDEEKFRNVAAFNETVGGNRQVNVRAQRATTEFFNRALLGQEPDRSIVEEAAASFGEAARDPVFLAETTAGFVGGVALKSGRLPVDARVVQQSQVTRGVPNPGGRLGSPATRAQVDQVASELVRREFQLTGGGGRLPEEFIRGAGGGRRGSAFPDITAIKSGKTLRINTIDTLRDGVTPTARESRNAARIRSLRPEDRLLLIPKKKVLD